MDVVSPATSFHCRTRQWNHLSKDKILKGRMLNCQLKQSESCLRFHSSTNMQLHKKQKQGLSCAELQTVPSSSSICEGTTCAKFCHRIGTSVSHSFSDCSLFWKSREKKSLRCHALRGAGHSDAQDTYLQDGQGRGHTDAQDTQLQDEVNSLSGYTSAVFLEEAKSSVVRKNAGRTGTASFTITGENLSGQLRIDESIQVLKGDLWPFLVWILGPLALVSSVVLPPFLLRKLFEALVKDSLLTDFLILFFTEILFYAGVAVFLVNAHKVQQSSGAVTWNSDSFVNIGYRISSVVTLILSIVLPIGAFALVWPWTGPAAAAALFPYTAGLAVQYGFEHFVRNKGSFVWPLIPIVFQVYRLHQLNRATQLVAGLLYSLRGAEATAEAMAVNGSLQTLFSILQILGLVCVWSLAAFTIHIFSSRSRFQPPELASS